MSFLSSFPHSLRFIFHDYKARYCYLRALRHRHFIGGLSFGECAHSIAGDQRPCGTWMCTYSPQKLALLSCCTFILDNFGNLVFPPGSRQSYLRTLRQDLGPKCEMCQYCARIWVMRLAYSRTIWQRWICRQFHLASEVASVEGSLGGYG